MEEQTAQVKVKKKKPFSATGYSAKYLRKQGYEVDFTEQNRRVPNPAYPGTFKVWKVDLFNCVDLIAIKSKEMPIWVQTTTVANQAARIEKLAGIKAVVIMLKTGHIRLHVHGWSLKGPRGGAKSWRVTITQVTLDDDGFLQTEVLDTITVDKQADLDFEEEPF